MDLWAPPKFFIPNFVAIITVFSLVACGASKEPEIRRKKGESVIASDLDSEASSGNDQNGQKIETESEYSKMLILGDSISVGVLSETSLGDTLSVSVSASQVSLKVSDETELVLPINRVLNQDFTINAEYIVSELLKLQEKYKARPSAFFGGIDIPEDKFSLASNLGLSSSQVYHAGFSGFKSGEVLNVSLPQALRSSRNFDLVVLEIGANDFCGTQEPSDLLKDFRSNIQGIFEKLEMMTAPPQLVIVPVPNIPAILDPVQDFPVLSVDVEFVGRQTITCRQLQRHYCPRIEQDEDAISELVADLNAVLDEEVEIYNENQDGPAALIVNAISDANNFPDNTLSIDCFHPGPVGHSIISQAVYRELSNK